MNKNTMSTLAFDIAPLLFSFPYVNICRDEARRFPVLRLFTVVVHCIRYKEVIP